MKFDALFIETIPPYQSLGIHRVPDHFFATAVWTFFHISMDVKTVLNLEADSRGLCQDAITNTQEVGDGDYQENLDAILLYGNE